VTPLETDDGELVAINRGWVPRLWVAGSDERDATAPTGRVELAGRIFASVDGGRVGGEPTPAGPELSRLDLDAAEQALGVELAERWVQLEDDTVPFGELPVPVPPPSLDEGPHLSYAFQWFMFATGTVVAYWLILRRRRREADLVLDPDEPARPHDRDMESLNR